MKIALMSDIHGNPKAFKNALDDAKRKKADRIVCLGDVVGYGYDPASCIALAKENCDIVIKGNHDAGVAGELSLRWFSETACKGVMRHSNQLDEADKNWLKSLNYRYRDTRHKFVCAHGTYIRPEEFEYINQGIMAQFDLEGVSREEGGEYRIEFVGHTHYSEVYDFTIENPRHGSYRLYSQCDGIGTFNLENGHAYSFNVGSVGYPRNEIPSVYVIYDTCENTVEYRRLEFDAKEYQNDLGRTGISIPHWLSKRIDCIGKKD